MLNADDTQMLCDSRYSYDSINSATKKFGQFNAIYSTIAKSNIHNNFRHSLTQLKPIDHMAKFFYQILLGISSN